MLKLIVGLGNPGATHAHNRHNAGFMAVDRMHERWSGGSWRKKFYGLVAEATIRDRRVMFLKPATFMNESGRAVSEAARFCKVARSDMGGGHDEIELAPGRFRMKTGGGAGGHNGLKSITAHMGDGYRRLRIGVGHPGRKEMVPGYVLHDFARGDAAWLTPLLDALAANAPLLVQGDDAGYASKVHLMIADGRQARRTETVAAPPPVQHPPERRVGKTPLAVLSSLFRK